MRLLVTKTRWPVQTLRNGRILRSRGASCGLAPLNGLLGECQFSGHGSGADFLGKMTEASHELFLMFHWLLDVALHNALLCRKEAENIKHRFLAPGFVGSSSYGSRDEFCAYPEAAEK